MKHYVCEEHVDIILDEIVMEFETPPIIEKYTGEEDLSTNCEYCGEKSAYIVANIDSNTK